MQQNAVMEKINTVFTWIAKMAYVHALWMLFSMAGLVITGVFPATVALLAVCRKWLNGESDAPVFRTFSTAFKASLAGANKIGYSLVFVSLMLYGNFLAIEQFGTNMLTIAAFYVVIALIALTSTHLFPVYIEGSQPLVQLWKTAFLVSLINWPFSLAILVSQSALYYALFSYPSAALFFLSSVLGIVQMWLVRHSFRRIERKKAALVKSKSAQSDSVERTTQSLSRT